MAYFARKLRYGACDGEAGAHYLAFIELAKKKGGPPVWFVLYRRIMQYNFPAENRTEMIRLSAKTTEEAIRRFWPLDERGAGKEFPGHRSDKWQKTTLWLDSVAAGGAYECFGYENHYGRGIRFGKWAKVGRPALRMERRKRRKKKPLQIGNLGHILLAHRERLHVLFDEKCVLTQRLSSLEEYDDKSDSNFVPPENEAESDEISAEVERLDSEIDSVWADITRIKAEMLYKVRLRFPKPMRIPLKRSLRQQSHLAW